MEPRNQPGSRQLISCSGGFHDASLRVIRHGMEFKEIHFLESLSLTRVFAIGSQNTNTDHLIALSTDMKTLFLTTQTIEENDKKSPVEPGLSSQELIQVDLPLISEEPTFLLTQIEDEIIIQATLSGIYVYDFVTYTAITSWSLPVGSNLIDAYFSCTYFLAASGSTLYCLVLNNNTFFTLLNTKSFNSDISCIDLAPIANLASVGLWNGDVFLINVPSFELYDHVNLGEMCARSIRIAIWSEKLHFLCGLGNGQLISFECCVNKPGLNEKVEMHIGTQPIRLSRFQRDGKTLLFSCCDRPAVLSGSNTGKLLCSNINLE
ncbi:DNA damage-binding protein 1, partial [Coelomomyces lativittatus]